MTQIQLCSRPDIGILATPKRITQARNFPSFHQNASNFCFNSSHKSTPNLRFFSTESPDTKKENMSFIDRVKVHGANALLGYFTWTNGFDSCIKGLHVEKVEKGQVICRLEVTPNFLNSYGTLHGGAISVLTDIVGTMALLTENPLKPGVSIELSVSFMNAAKEKDMLQIVGKALKVGKTIGFTQVDFLRPSDGKLIASAKHTKAL